MNRVTTEVEDQQKFIVPINRDTEKIYYNQRMLIDTGVVTEPRAWHVSKINRTSPVGVCHATLAQDHFDANLDYVEKDTAGNVIGLWANYYKSPVVPVPPMPTPTGKHIEFTYSGANPKIKIGGSAKSFTVHFYNNSTEIPVEPGVWDFTIGGVSALTLITQSISGSTNKIKFIGGEDYIGKILKVEYIATDGITRGAINVPLVSL